MNPFPWVEGGFGTIVSDFPWKFGNQATRASTDKHYPTMTQRELLRLPIAEIAAKDAHWYCWTTDAHLKQAIELIEANEFEPVQTLVWVKTTDEGKLKIGLGNYYRHAHELVIFARRGKAPAFVHNLPSVFWATREKHSAKPEILQTWAEQLSPGPRVELFARRQRVGWTCWGNEAEGPLLGNAGDTSGVPALRVTVHSHPHSVWVSEMPDHRSDVPGAVPLDP